MSVPSAGPWPGADDVPFTRVAGTLAGAVALLPWGSCEAHGPHLPLSTDRWIAVAVAGRAAARLKEAGVAVHVLPPVGLGVTDFARSFEGTLTLSAGTVRGLVADLAASCFAHGARLVAVVNHHLEPAHFDALAAGASDASQRGHRTVVCDHRQRRFALGLGDDFCRGGAHAGSYETSLMLAIRPDLVDACYVSLADVPVNLGKRIREGARTLLEVGGDRAYLGDPARASREEGEALLDKLAEVVVLTVREALHDEPVGSQR